METAIHVEGKDEKSGILLRKNTRVATEDEILAKVTTRREFVAVEKIDDLATR